MWVWISAANTSANVISESLLHLYCSYFPSPSIFALRLFLCTNDCNQRYWLADWWPFSCLKSATLYGNNKKVNRDAHRNTIVLPVSSPTLRQIIIWQWIGQSQEGTQHSKDRKWRRGSAYQTPPGDEGIRGGCVLPYRCLWGSPCDRRGRKWVFNKVSPSPADKASKKCGFTNSFFPQVRPDFDLLTIKICQVLEASTDDPIRFCLNQHSADFRKIERFKHLCTGDIWLNSSLTNFCWTVTMSKWWHMLQQHKSFPH